MLNYSLCQMKDATINVYDWLGIEVWIIVSRGIELAVCLRAVKTRRCLAIVMHFNYHLIVWLCREGHFLQRLRKKGHVTPVGGKWDEGRLSDADRECPWNCIRGGHESRLSHSLCRYHICEHWWHHTSLISEINHSAGAFNTFFRPARRW